MEILVHAQRSQVVWSYGHFVEIPPWQQTGQARAIAWTSVTCSHAQPSKIVIGVMAHDPIDRSAHRLALVVPFDRCADPLVAGAVA